MFRGPTKTKDPRIVQSFKSQKTVQDTQTHVNLIDIALNNKADIVDKSLKGMVWEM